MSERVQHHDLVSLQLNTQVTSDYQVSDVTERKTKTGRPYWDIALRDRTGTHVARLWDSPDVKCTEMVQALVVPGYVYVSGHTECFSNETRLIIELIGPLSDVDVDETNYVRRVDDLPYLTETLTSLVEKDTGDPTLNAVLRAVFNDSAVKEAFSCLPAGENGTFSGEGGVLRQAVGASLIVDNATWAVQADSLTRALANAGCFLSNIGKLSAYTFVDKVAKFTPAGRLTGEAVFAYTHLSGVVERLRTDLIATRALAGVDDEAWSLDENVVTRLLHLVLSSRRCGVQPLTLEGIVVRHALETLDELTRVQHFTLTASGPQIGGDMFTPFDNTAKRCYLKTTYTSNE